MKRHNCKQRTLMCRFGDSRHSSSNWQSIWNVGSSITFPGSIYEYNRLFEYHPAGDHNPILPAMSKVCFTSESKTKYLANRSGITSDYRSSNISDLIQNKSNSQSKSKCQIIPQHTRLFQDECHNFQLCIIENEIRLIELFIETNDNNSNQNYKNYKNYKNNQKHNYKNTNKNRNRCFNNSENGGYRIYFYKCFLWRFRTKGKNGDVLYGIAEVNDYNKNKNRKNNYNYQYDRRGRFGYNNSKNKKYSGKEDEYPPWILSHILNSGDVLKHIEIKMKRKLSKDYNLTSDCIGILNKNEFEKQFKENLPNSIKHKQLLFDPNVEINFNLEKVKHTLQSKRNKKKYQTFVKDIKDMNIIDKDFDPDNQEQQFQFYEKKQNHHMNNNNKKNKNNNRNGNTRNWQSVLRFENARNFRRRDQYLNWQQRSQNESCENWNLGCDYNYTKKSMVTAFDTFFETKLLSSIHASLFYNKLFPQLAETQIYIDKYKGVYYQELLLLLEVDGGNGKYYKYSMAFIVNRVKDIHGKYTNKILNYTLNSINTPNITMANVRLASKNNKLDNDSWVNTMNDNTLSFYKNYFNIRFAPTRKKQQKLQKTITTTTPSGLGIEHLHPRCEIDLTRVNTGLHVSQDKQTSVSKTILKRLMDGEMQFQVPKYLGCFENSICLTTHNTEITATNTTCTTRRTSSGNCFDNSENGCVNENIETRSSETFLMQGWQTKNNDYQPTTKGITATTRGAPAATKTTQTKLVTGINTPGGDFWNSCGDSSANLNWNGVLKSRCKKDRSRNNGNNNNRMKNNRGGSINQSTNNSNNYHNNSSTNTMIGEDTVVVNGGMQTVLDNTIGINNYSNNSCTRYCVYGLVSLLNDLRQLKNGAFEAKFSLKLKIVYLLNVFYKFLASETNISIDRLANVSIENIVFKIPNCQINKDRHFGKLLFVSDNIENAIKSPNIQILNRFIGINGNLNNYRDGVNNTSTIQLRCHDCMDTLCVMMQQVMTFSMDIRMGSDSQISIEYARNIKHCKDVANSMNINNNVESKMQLVQMLNIMDFKIVQLIELFNMKLRNLLRNEQMKVDGYINRQEFSYEMTNRKLK